MERLTRKDDTFYSNVISGIDGLDAIAQKLGKLEDLEEQGRLITLPCDIGDTIYEVRYVHKCDICPNNKIGKCKFDGGNVECVESRITIDETQFTLDHYSIYTQSLRKDLYLTREEAEKKLEEMKSEDTKGNC